MTTVDERMIRRKRKFEDIPVDLLDFSADIAFLKRFYKIHSFLISLVRVNYLAGQIPASLLFWYSLGIPLIVCHSFECINFRRTFYMKLLIVKLLMHIKISFPDKSFTIYVFCAIPFANLC